MLLKAYYILYRVIYHSSIQITGLFWACLVGEIYVTLQETIIIGGYVECDIEFIVIKSNIKDSIIRDVLCLIGIYNIAETLLTILILFTELVLKDCNRFYWIVQTP